MLKLFLPSEHVKSIFNIDPQELKKEGLRASLPIWIILSLNGTGQQPPPI